MEIKKGIAKLTLDKTEGGYRHVVNSELEVYEKTEGAYIEIVSKLLSHNYTTYDDRGNVMHTNSKNEENFGIYPNTIVDKVLNKYKIFSDETVEWLESLRPVS